MYKKSAVLLVWVFCLSGTILALGPDTRKLTTAHRAMVGFSSLSLYDGYLSGETYEGPGLQVHYSTTRYPSVRNTRFLNQQDVELLTATTQNAAGTAIISHTAIHYAWGTLFTLKPFYGIKTAVGPMVGASVGARMNSRNVNNPYNFDLISDVLLAGNLTYDFPVGPRDIRLKASLRIPVLGCQFAPERGISYYEMLSFGEYEQAFHFTSFHNKNAWSGQYTVDIPLDALVVSLGLMHNYSLFSANDMLFKQQNWSLQVGCTFDVVVFSGAARPKSDRYLFPDR